MAIQVATAPARHDPERVVAVVHALAALPWVILIVGVGLCAVEPELEESALLDYGPGRVLLHVTLRRALGAIAAAALAVTFSSGLALIRPMSASRMESRVSAVVTT